MELETRYKCNPDECEKLRQHNFAGTVNVFIQDRNADLLPNYRISQLDGITLACKGLVNVQVVKHPGGETVDMPICTAFVASAAVSIVRIT